MEAVRRGQAWGTLYFTENFTDALVARMLLGKEADNETLDQSEIRVWLDMSSKSHMTEDEFPKELSNCYIIDKQFVLYTLRNYAPGTMIII